VSRAVHEAVHPESPADARTDGQATPEGRRLEGADPRRWRALAVTQLAAFMVLLDVSIVNVALPSIERDLAVSAMTAQWVISGYSLAVGLALVPAGRLGDSLGRRRMFLIALSAFVLSSALTGAAPTADLLIAARLIQGLAGGMLIPQNSGLIQELFQGAERGRAFGILGSTIGIATAAGPVIGGLILGIPGPDAWRWVFYVNVPIGVIALLLAARLLPATTRAGWHGIDLDLLGSLLLGGGVLALLIPVVDAADGGLSRLWWLWGVGALLLALFSWWETRTAARGRGAAARPAAEKHSRLRRRVRDRTRLLHWVHRNLAGARAVLAGRLGVFAVALGAVRHPIRNRCDRFGRHRGPTGAAVRTLADPVRAYRDGGRAAHDSPAAATHRRRVGAMGHNWAAGCGRSGRRHGHFTKRHADPRERAGTNGRRRRRRPADRATHRGGNRHRYGRHDLLPRSEPNRS
jgi:MFS family permease